MGRHPFLLVPVTVASRTAAWLATVRLVPPAPAFLLLQAFCTVFIFWQLPVDCQNRACAQPAGALSPMPSGALGAQESLPPPPSGEPLVTSYNTRVDETTLAPASNAISMSGEM